MISQFLFDVIKVADVCRKANKVDHLPENQQKIWNRPFE